MDSGNDSYFEESSESEEETADPIHIKVNIEEYHESPSPESPSPVLPQAIPLGELSPVWKLPDDGINFLNYYTRAVIVELKKWSQATRDRIKEEGYFVEERIVLQSLAAFLQQNYGPQGE